mmetsp:Transcript_48254/g.76760  ORF Transcript_48254/g.76760 Transcript_48254/m.76760 type:complete len:239 (-) Transcript_48254:83-799(-)
MHSSSCMWQAQLARLRLRQLQRLLRQVLRVRGQEPQGFAHILFSDPRTFKKDLQLVSPVATGIVGNLTSTKVDRNKVGTPRHIQLLAQHVQLLPQELGGRKERIKDLRGQERRRLLWQTKSMHCLAQRWSLKQRADHPVVHVDHQDLLRISGKSLQIGLKVSPLVVVGQMPKSSFGSNATSDAPVDPSGLQKELQRQRTLRVDEKDAVGQDCQQKDCDDTIQSVPMSTTLCVGLATVD